MKVAVVGSGVSGLAATWLLNEFSEHEVHLYEADDRPGGHANTVTFTPPGRDEPIDVDTGFIVFNPSTYPNFLSFLSLYPDLKRRILPTEMTFSVSRDHGLFEWAGKNLATVFCQPSRLLDMRMWRLLYDVLRFNACARRLVMSQKGKIADEPEGLDISIGDYLEKEGYSDAFRDDYLVPMTAAIWSTPPDKCALDFPARTLIQFMNNHHLLQVTGKPSWLTLNGGSRTYVNQIVSKLPLAQLHLSTPIHSLRNLPTSSPTTSTTTIVIGKPEPSSPPPVAFHQVELATANGTTEVYDHVILACHSDTALDILRNGGEITDEEERILSGIKWNRNECVLHSDPSLMPKKRVAWSCWNYLTTSEVDSKGKRKANIDQVSLTYGMNDLQHLDEREHGPVLVTLNPPFEPSEALTIGRYTYDHPLLDRTAVRSQEEFHTIQNARGVSFAGAWLRYGFHEDGFASGLRAVMNIPGWEDTIQPPFPIKSAESEPKPAASAIIFDVLEGTGLSTLFGKVLGTWLGVVKTVLGVVVNLNHLEEPAEVKVDLKGKAKAD